FDKSLTRRLSRVSKKEIRKSKVLPESLTTALLYSVASAIAGGIVGGIPVGMYDAIASGIFTGLVVGFLFSRFVQASFPQDRAMCARILGICGLLFGILGGVYYWTLAGVRAGITIGILLAIAFIVAGLRLYYYVIHLLFMQFRPHGRRYVYHPISWDDMCLTPFAGLNELLLDYHEYNPRAAYDEINRLIRTQPLQRHSALSAEAILVLREASRASHLIHLSAILDRLPVGERGVLQRTPEIKAWGR